MKSYVVLTAIGQDRRGLVDVISEFLSARDINIEDSRMAVLGGEFAVILLASGDGNPLDEIKSALAALEEKTGLSIQLKPTVAPGDRKVKPSIPHKISATSMDHPGIVHEITRLLHGREINIESLETHVSNAPLSGAPIFTMRGVVSVPVEIKMSALKKELRELGDRLNVDVEIEPAETF